jgi:hypothetical protein
VGCVFQYCNILCQLMGLACSCYIWSVLISWYSRYYEITLGIMSFSWFVMMVMALLILLYIIKCMLVIWWYPMLCISASSLFALSSIMCRLSKRK